ncbi:MAG: thiamine pyrophosphate-dependent enzyme [Candidatus Dormibacteraceae bacterium]
MNVDQRLGRKLVVERVVAACTSDAIFVASFGSASYYLFEVGDRPLNLYTFGGMGQASSLGLGIALARPDRQVIVIDGDGALLMNLSILAVVAEENPPLFLHVVLDDGAYESTGGQPTATSRKVELTRVAQGCGIVAARRVVSELELSAALDEWKARGGPILLDAVVRVERSAERPRFDPLYYRYRFRDALLKEGSRC